MKQDQRKQLFTWLGGGMLIAIIVVIAFILVNNQENDGNTIVGGPANAATVVPGPSIPSSVQQNGNVLGDPNAPILVVEYGDYQCPFCTRFARQDMLTLLDEFIATGKIRFEFHEYPIVGNSNGVVDQGGESFQAAEAALCANDQGQYWPYHDLLYANSVGEFKGSFSPERLKQIATLLPEMDQESFNTCVDNRTHTADVQALTDSALLASIGSTPTFVVNGQQVVGADYAQLKDVIEAQLAGP